MDELRRLLLEKEKEAPTDEEKNKVEVLKELLEEDDIFFSLDVSAAFGILNFLVIPYDKLESTYYQLISYDNYLNSMPKYEVNSLNDTLHYTERYSHTWLFLQTNFFPIVYETNAQQKHIHLFDCYLIWT